MSVMKSFSAATAEEGHQPGSRLLSLRHERAADAVATFLEVDEDDWIWVVERLRLADDEPIGISYVYLSLPPDILLSPVELDQEVSLWSILTRKGITLASSEETIQAVEANKDQADFLQVNIGFPLLLVEGIVYTDQALPVEYHQIYNRGDRYKYAIRTVR
jgi:GntR family transcriptional regulator